MRIITVFIITFCTLINLYGKENKLKQTNIVVVGDSTVATYTPDSDKLGWGQLIGDFFDSNIKVINTAVGGRSTKTFIKEGRWDRALAKCRRGDYVFIQFGHNDSHAKDRPESTDAATDYKEYLRKYVDDAKAKGVTPILITPMHRRVFSKKSGKLSKSLKPYAEAMKEVASKKGVVCIDLYNLSGTVMQKRGDKGCLDLFCNPKDRSHFSEKGACLMAELIVKDLSVKNTGLEKYIKEGSNGKMKTAEELNEYKRKHEEECKAETGKDKIWGDTNIPELLKPKGKVLYKDNFANLKNWHHEGGGKLTQPEKNIIQLNCIGSRQGQAGCMAFCRTDFPDNICIEYDMKVVTSKGLVITFIAAQGRNGEDMITELPAREGIFADYISNPRMRSYHVSVSRYNDKGEHTGVSNWRRNPGIFMMGQQEDLCKNIGEWYHISIIKKGGLLQLAVNGKLAGGFNDPDKIPEKIPAKGKIGFRAIGSEVIAQIKNFKVSALD